MNNSTIRFCFYKCHVFVLVLILTGGCSRISPEQLETSLAGGVSKGVEKEGDDSAEDLSSDNDLETTEGKDSIDIFAKLWNLPDSHVRVSKLGPDGTPADPAAKVVVHEQDKAGNCLDDDHADKKLLSNVDESLFDEPTFRTFIALLDNYTAAELKPEVTFDDAANEHWREVDEFLDAVFETVTMKVAVEHIQTELAQDATLSDVRALTRKMWFEPYTNQYQNDQPFCVGFEHVFVGEDESGEGGAPRCEDRVGGYHSWVKILS